jgi:hypothetical protein
MDTGDGHICMWQGAFACITAFSFQTVPKLAN